jgi:hypothetical protein
MVGGAGLVTVTVAVAVAMRFAPSVTVRLMLAVPD